MSREDDDDHDECIGDNIFTMVLLTWAAVMVMVVIMVVMLLIIDNYDDNAVAHLGGREEEGAGLATLPLPQAPSISLHLRVAY